MVRVLFNRRRQDFVILHNRRSCTIKQFRKLTELTVDSKPMPVTKKEALLIVADPVLPAPLFGGMNSGGMSVDCGLRYDCRTRSVAGTSPVHSFYALERSIMNVIIDEIPAGRRVVSPDCCGKIMRPYS